MQHCAGKKPDPGALDTSEVYHVNVVANVYAHQDVMNAVLMIILQKWFLHKETNAPRGGQNMQTLTNLC